MRRHWMTSIESGESSPYLSWSSTTTNQLMDKIENYEWHRAFMDEKLWQTLIILVLLDEQSITLSHIIIHLPLACYVAHNQSLMIQKHITKTNRNVQIFIHGGTISSITIRFYVWPITNSSSRMTCRYRGSSSTLLSLVMEAIASRERFFVKIISFVIRATNPQCAWLPSAGSAFGHMKAVSWMWCLLGVWGGFG